MWKPLSSVHISRIPTTPGQISCVLQLSIFNMVTSFLRSYDLGSKVKYHPYYIKLTHALNKRDMQLRIQFSQWTEQMIRYPNFFKYVIFSEDSTLKNNDELNRYNCYYWLVVNSYWKIRVGNQHQCLVWDFGLLFGWSLFLRWFCEWRFFLFLRDHFLQLHKEVDLRTRQRKSGCNWMGPHFTTHYKLEKI